VVRGQGALSLWLALAGAGRHWLELAVLRV